MNDFHAISYNDKTAFYRELRSEAEGLMDVVWITNLANFSALVMAHLPEINWVGFYLAQNVGQRENLVLGPFQGRPACLTIPIGKGVCGTAAFRRQTVLVADVEEFPGHIACDARSRSEIVVPVVKDGRLLGVLDIDSPKLARFDESDRNGLESLVEVLIAKTDWPAAF
jgi:GAF domain-containing protein